ncbi:MAG: Rho termination factor N-terminal domain-containing protein, partial [Peptococcaceae bacterium]|nr:Rho termination factor N-terminal domain-containing protein [Peptococcaceae bacterium]
MVELYRIARELEIAGYSKLRKAELIHEIQKKSVMKDREGQLWSSGILDIMAEGGFGFLRPSGYIPSNDDIYVSPSQIRKFDLRSGDKVEGWSRKPKENERY